MSGTLIISPTLKSTVGASTFKYSFDTVEFSNPMIYNKFCSENPHAPFESHKNPSGQYLIEKEPDDIADHVPHLRNAYSPL